MSRPVMCFVWTHVTTYFDLYSCDMEQKPIFFNVKMEYVQVGYSIEICATIFILRLYVYLYFQ